MAIYSQFNVKLYAFYAKLFIRKIKVAIKEYFEIYVVIRLNSIYSGTRTSTTETTVSPHWVEKLKQKIMRNH